MPTITVDGIGKFTVDDTFAKLSPQEQHDSVDEMVEAARSSGAATPPAVSHSLPGAALNSLVNGIPEAIHSGEASLGHALDGSRFGNFLDSLGGTTTAQSAASAAASARQNAADSAMAYSRPSSVPSSLTDAVSGASGIGDGIARVGKALTYDGAENAAPLAANLALSAVPGVGELNAARLAGTVGLGTAAKLALGIGAGSVDGLQALGGVRDTKLRAGLADTTTKGDVLNAALQLGLMRAGGGAGGVVDDAAGSVLSRLGGTAAGVGTSAAKGGLAPVANDVGALLQGGDLTDGKGAAANAAAVASDALEGAGAGAALHGVASAGKVASSGIGATVGMMRDSNHLAKLGGAGTLAELSSHATQANAWQGAVSKATDDLKAQYPAASDDDLTTMAQQKVAADGVSPPAALSINAQRLQDDVNTLHLYTTRQAASSGSSSQSPTQVMKGTLADVKGDLTASASAWKQAGTITPQAHADLTAAITEAAAHNRALGTGDDSHSDTAYERVGNIDGLSDDQKGQVQSLLRVADTLSQNALLKNSHGPLAMLGQGLGAAVGHTLAVPLHAVPVVGHAAALSVGHAVGGFGKKLGAGADAGMGVGLPPLLARQNAIQGAATAAGITPTVTAMDLQGLRDSATSGVQAIASAKVAAAQQRAAAASKAADVTSAVTGAFGPGDPGWMASVGQANGITSDSIRRFISAGVASGKLTQDQADHLNSTSDIGPAIGPLATAIRNQVQAGQWDKATSPATSPAPAAGTPQPPVQPPAPSDQPMPAPATAPVQPPVAMRPATPSAPPPVMPPATAPATVSGHAPVISVAPPVPPMPPVTGRTMAPSVPPVMPPAATVSGHAPVISVPAPVVSAARAAPGTGTPPVQPPAPAAAPTASGPLPADVLALLRRQAGSMPPRAAGPASPLSVMAPAAPMPPVLPPVASSARYNAVTAQDRGIQNSIRTVHPDLADIVNEMATGKSVAARQAIMETRLARMFGNGQLGALATARAILQPLTNFGTGRR